MMRGSIPVLSVLVALLLGPGLPALPHKVSTSGMTTGNNTANYRRSGNFRVIKFSCFKFSRKNIFVVQDTHENFLTVLRSQGLVIWNETTHAKSTNSLHAAFMATMQVLTNY